MRYALIVALFLGVNLFGVEAVQNNDCTTAECQNAQTNQTTVDSNGMVHVANTKAEARAEVDRMDNEASVSGTSSVETLRPNRTIVINVIGQGVAPVNTTSPAQAYALAKRAAIADGYRLIAEKVQGVEIEGQDLIKNMMVKSSTVRTAVFAKVKNAQVTQTTFRDGLCEVEMEIRLSYGDFVH